MTERICIVCGKALTPKSGQRKYCSEKCRKKGRTEAYKKPKVYFNCEWCGVGLPKGSTDKYCSD